MKTFKIIPLSELISKIPKLQDLGDVKLSDNLKGAEIFSILDSYGEENDLIFFQILPIPGESIQIIFYENGEG